MSATPAPQDPSAPTTAAADPIAAAAPGDAAPADAFAGRSAESAEAAEAKGFADVVKRIALGAAEAVHISPDEVKGFVTRLVEKGELAQQDGRRIVQELGERIRRVVREPVTTARGAAEEATGAIKSLADRLARREREGEGAAAASAEGAAAGAAASVGADEQAGALIERINASIERVLGAMHIASAKEVDGLRDKIDGLDKKLEQIAERLGVSDTADVA